jgi:hypothetical protein
MTAPSYYKHHIFFCLNQRENGQASCADHDAQGSADHCKSRVKKLGLAGPGGVRVNKAGWRPGGRGLPGGRLVHLCGPPGH